MQLSHGRSVTQLYRCPHPPSAHGLSSPARPLSASTPLREAKVRDPPAAAAAAAEPRALPRPTSSRPPRPSPLSQSAAAQLTTSVHTHVIQCPVACVPIAALAASVHGSSCGCCFCVLPSLLRRLLPSLLSLSAVLSTDVFLGHSHHRHPRRVLRHVRLRAEVPQAKGDHSTTTTTPSPTIDPSRHLTHLLLCCDVRRC